jgi:hypothetical protein
METHGQMNDDVRYGGGGGRQATSRASGITEFAHRTSDSSLAEQSAEAEDGLLGNSCGDGSISVGQIQHCYQPVEPSTLCAD